MKFPTMFDEHERVFCSSGSKVGFNKAIAVDENGHTFIKTIDTYDIQEEINSHADSVDIKTILKQFEAGNVEVLNQKHGIFTDITQFPDNFADMYNLVVDGENYFASLPIEIREKFNNSFGEFISSVGTEKFINAFKENVTVNGSAVTEGAAATEKEVVENE